jgi:hypothetical protein
MISVVKIAENDTNLKEDSKLVHVADDMIGQHGSRGKKGVLGQLMTTSYNTSLPPFKSNQ